MRVHTFISATASLMFSAVVALAAPPNTATLDGRPIEYDDIDLVGVNPKTNNNFGAGNVITNLFVTWDSTYVYFALQGREVNDKLTIMIDVDPGNGTGANTTTNWSGTEAQRPNFVRFNDVGWEAANPADFGLDYQIASEGFFNNIMRVEYNGFAEPGTNNVRSLFDNGNGVQPQSTPVDMVVLADGTDCPLKGIEARIPWSVLYTNNLFGTVQPGEVVPQGAALRVFAVLHNNDPLSAFSSDGIIPEQTSPGSSLVNGIWTTTDYIDITVDGNNDGLPDLGVGDVNAPYLKYVSGVQNKQEVFAWFNEDVVAALATNTANWLIDGANPVSATLVQSDAVLLSLSSPLPAAGTLVKVQAAGVEDASGNFKTAYLCLDPSVSGIETSITVRFVLHVNSGFGLASANPRATNFFINGGSAPLEFGYPPVMSSPLSVLNATQHYRDVTFPPGTASKLFYKYSGVLSQGGLATGTNNYEVIRLDNFADVARQLTLPTNGITSLVVTDFLGAVAAPFRNPSTNSGYNAVYTDPRRGDAGVRRRTTILFQLDLSERNLQGVSRVFVQGTDPLRGFNLTSSAIDDFAGNLGWVDGGIDLVDDGTLGDLAPSDGIYSRRWSFSTNGVDDVTEPDFPNSLVGGGDFTPPYFGTGWIDRRSPRSFKYKFYVYSEGSGTALDSPNTDIEYYIENISATNIVLEPFVWDDPALPLPPPSNAPSVVAISPSGTTARATFTNQVTELQHGLEISTNLIQGWLNYGTRATTTAVAGVWLANVANATGVEHYRAFAGPPKPFSGVVLDPYPIPATGATLRIYYTQHSRGLTGDRNVQIAGNWTSWNPVPMTFLGDGVWLYELNATTSTFANTEIKFKPRNLAGSFWDGMGGGNNDFFAYVGDLRATYSNPNPTNGELLTITYNANGGPLAAASNVNAYLGFDEQWFGAANRTMTNTSGNTNIWEVAITVPTNALLSVNFVFNNGPVGSGTTTWDSEGSAPPNGRQWRLFIDQPE